MIKLAAVAGAGLALPAVLTGCADDEDPGAGAGSGAGKRVLVVGAGVAGLAAAQLLQRQKAEVTVLEASDRIGGRTYTDRSLGFAFDEGASWIHGTRGNPITKLARAAGAPTTVLDTQPVSAYFADGKPASQSQIEAAFEGFEELLGSLADDGEQGVSFARVLVADYPEALADPLINTLLSAYLTFDTGPLDQLSSLYYDADEAFGGDEAFMADGYEWLPKQLAEGLDVRLGSAVTAIEHGEQGAVVRLAGGKKLEADSVVVTVPLGVLKADTISFSPRLSAEKRTAIKRVGFNVVDKFAAVWDRRYWDESAYIFSAAAKKDRFNFFVSTDAFDPGSHGLVSFAFADAARKLEQKSETEAFAEMLASLRAIYGEDFPEPKQTKRTRWAADPNIRGGYSFPAVDIIRDDYDMLAAPTGTTLFFAGEHTERDYPATVHGAYLSGRRAAAEALEI